MTIGFGSGELSFELVNGWEHVPDGWHHFDVPAICTEASGNVYAYWRGDHSIVVYDRKGRCLDSWRRPPFDVRAHGIFMSRDNRVYLVDEGSSSVGCFTLAGDLVNQIGPSGSPSESGYDGVNYRTITHGAPPYNRPAGVGVAPSGEVYIADGYGNSRVHRFTPGGELVQSWGEPGRGVGQFHVPHDLWVHTDGRVFVADRENDRIQVFSSDGQLESVWTDVQRPQGLFIDPDGVLYVAEGVWPVGWESQRRGPFTTAEPGRISLYDLEGNVLVRWSNPDPAEPGYLLSPHGIWVDDEGAIYVSANVGTMGEVMGIGTGEALLKFARR